MSSAAAPASVPSTVQQLFTEHTITTDLPESACLQDSAEPATVTSIVTTPADVPGAPCLCLISYLCCFLANQRAIADVAGAPPEVDGGEWIPVKTKNREPAPAPAPCTIHQLPTELTITTDLPDTVHVQDSAEAAMVTSEVATPADVPGVPCLCLTLKFPR